MPKGIYLRTRKPVEERFWAKVKKLELGCWEWQGCCQHGYGAFRNNGNTVRAHRFSFMYFNNTSIPEDFELDHLCRNRKCVNPEHLEIVTRKENLNRSKLVLLSRGAKNRSKTHCPKGHPYNDINTYHIPTGGRGCKICRREWNRVHRDNLKRLMED